jgi:polar amino acid transport system substrate-binding protein
MFGLAAGGVALAAAAAPSIEAAAQVAKPNSTFDKIKRTGVLSIAVIVGQEPYFHKDIVSGQWSGACIEMANTIAQKLGAKVEMTEATWGTQILDLQSGKIDLAFAVNPTPERALVIDFSTPMLVHSFSLITRPGFPKPTTWADVNKPEVKIAVDLGSSHEQIARRYCPKATILGFPTRDEAVLAVSAGRADCEVVLALLAITTMKKNPHLGAFVAPRPVLTLPTNMAFRIEDDLRFKNFLSAFADYNRSLGVTREWVLGGLAAGGIGPDDVPPEVQF